MNKHLRGHYGPASLLALAYLIFLYQLWAPGAPAGADTWGHLFRAEYLAQAIRDHGWGAYFSAAWMPEWYMGDPFRLYYPWLTTALLTPLVWLLNSPALAFKALISLAAAGLAAGTYMVLDWEWEESSWPAGLGAALVLLAPYQLRTIGFEGNVPRYLSLLALPFILLATERLLRTDGRRIPWVLTAAASWTWAIAAHPQQAFMFAIGFGLYVAFRLFLDADLPLTRSLYWLAGLTAGAGLSAAWTLPAYAGLELSNVPNLPFEKVELFAAPLRAALPQLDLGAGAVSVGFGTFVLAVLATVSRPDPRRTAALIAGGIAVWLSFGPPAVLFSLLPLQSQLLPERFLNFAVFAFAVAAAGIVPFRKRARWARGAIVAGLVLLDVVPGLGVIRTAEIHPTEVALGRAVEQTQLAPGNRWALMTYPEPRASEVYVVANAAPTINGWALENTPHHADLRRYLSAPDWGPEYLDVLYERWAVEGVVLRADGEEHTQAVEALQSAGWRQDQSVGPYELWLDQDPPAALQQLSSDRMLVLGDRLAPMLAAFPFAEEAEATRLADFSDGALDAYSAAALYRFADVDSSLGSEARRLRRYAEQGGHVIMDLSGMQAIYGDSLDVLGVSVIGLTFQDSADLRWSSSTAQDTQSLDFGRVSDRGWTGATYRGLDEVIAEVEFSGQWYPVLGYRDIGQGRVWFIGMNLLYYTQQSGDDLLLERVQAIVLEGADVERQLPGGEIDLRTWNAHTTGLSLEYNSPESIEEALVSFTYHPRFQATLDGQPVPIRSFEHLIELGLPAGDHRLEIRHRPLSTPAPLMGWAVSLLTGIALAGSYVYERKTFLPELVGEGEEQVVSDQVHMPCANCGFLLSEVDEPTPVTYPFQVVHCPICGLSMDDEGFTPGDELDEEERNHRLTDWLKDHGYDPQTVHERWGFSPESFFDPEGVAPELPET